jgi:hypothetical protein
MTNLEDVGVPNFEANPISKSVCQLIFFAQHNLKNAISYISNNQAKQQPIHNWFDSSLEKC